MLGAYIGQFTEGSSQGIS